MNIFITGGAGYIGSALVNYLIKKEHRITVVDNFYKGRAENLFPNAINLKDKLSLHKVDIRDSEKIKELLIKEKPDAVIHCAAIVDAFTTNSPDKEILCREVIRDGTINLWKISRELGVKQFVNTSTVSLYSNGKDLTEDSKKEPLSNYAKMKWEAEEFIMKHPGMKTTSLRPATVVGYAPGIRYETVINLFMMYAATGQTLPVFQKALDNEKTFLDILDICRAYGFCLKNLDKVAGKSFNVVSYNITMREFINKLKKHFPNLKINLIDNANVSQQVYTVSGEKFNSLGFVPKPNLDKQIDLMKKYFDRQSEVNKNLLRDSLG